jgi:SPP1 gp7 family putative phage head morphogenesis protein
LVFSDPIDDKNLNQWTKSVRFADRTRFVEEIQNGLIVGDTATEISKRLFGTIRQAGTDGVRQITRRNLQGLAQTTINGITNRARSELYARNRDVFSKEIFVATLDSRTTPVCRANDGKEFNIGEGATPPLHFNCRSLRVPKLAVQKLAKRPASGVSKKLLEGLKGPERRAKVAQLTGQVPAETTYSQFLKRQTKGFQAEVMGVKKAKLFREGGLNLDNFVNQAGNELNLRQLQLAHPEAFVRAGIKL